MGRWIAYGLLVAVAAILLVVALSTTLLAGSDSGRGEGRSPGPPARTVP